MSYIFNPTDSSPVLPMVTGRWYGPSYINNNFSGAALVANTLYAIPFLVPASRTFDRIGIRVTTGAASSYIKCGIYADNGGVPGSLIYDPVTGLDSTAASDASFTISYSASKDSVIWLVCATNSTPSVLVAATSANNSQLGYADLSAVLGYNRVTGSFTYTAIDTPFPASFPTPTVVTAGALGIRLRAA